jgi:hypothetical protein
VSAADPDREAIAALLVGWTGEVTTPRILGALGWPTDGAARVARVMRELGWKRSRITLRARVNRVWRRA